MKIIIILSLPFGCALNLKLEEKNKIRFGVDAIKSAPGMTKQALIGLSSILSDKKNSSTLSIRIITRAIQLRQLSIRTAF
jgi:hypothetical protein